MGKKDRAALLKELEEITKPPGGVQTNAATDVSLRRMIAATAVLVKSVLFLDESSSRLAIVNIILAFVLVFIGIMQIVLMFRGH